MGLINNKKGLILVFILFALFLMTLLLLSFGFLSFFGDNNQPRYSLDSTRILNTRWNLYLEKPTSVKIIATTYDYPINTYKIFSYSNNFENLDLKNCKDYIKINDTDSMFLENNYTFKKGQIYLELDSLYKLTNSSDDLLKNMTVIFDLNNTIDYLKSEVDNRANLAKYPFSFDNKCVYYYNQTERDSIIIFADKNEKKLYLFESYLTPNNDVSLSKFNDLGNESESKKV